MEHQDKIDKIIQDYEKSLYQNILITGTIGSRQNQFFNGAFT